jgi:hypothetical protein
MFDIAELGEAGIRALGFWLWIVSPKYRAQVAAEWRRARAGRRAMMVMESAISAALGLGIPMLVWALLT